MDRLEALQHRVAELKLKEVQRQQGRGDLQKRLEQVRNAFSHRQNKAKMKKTHEISIKFP